MFETLKDFYQATSIIDLVYLLITILSLIKCYKKGFVLSILSMAKWLLAYVITLILFPRVKPYLKNIIDNEYVLDIGLGIAIFVVVIFLVLFINKGISGQTTPQILKRFDSDISIEKVKSVIILAGINDIAQNTGYISVSEIFANIINMVEVANSHNITPVLCSVLPANKIAWKPEIKSADLVIELNEKLKGYCTENNIAYVDYFSSMVGA